MLEKILRQLKKISQSHRYWLIFAAIGVTLLTTALIFQHILDDQPCLMCIQIRLLITLLIFASFAGLLLAGNRLMIAAIHLSTVLIAIALSERSYQLLGTERGFVFSDCGFDLGLPAWFAIEEWLPWLYRVETSCGYTPEIIFGITMAEALMVFSVLLLVVTSCVFIGSLLHIKTPE